MNTSATLRGTAKQRHAALRRLYIVVARVDMDYALTGRLVVGLDYRAACEAVEAFYGPALLATIGL